MEKFAVIGEKQIQNILDDKSSKNTKKATEVSFNILCTYLKTRKIDFNFTNINKSELNDVLRKFYVEVRKQDGSYYCKASLVALRFGIKRGIKQLDISINIIEDQEFFAANEVFKAQCVFLEKEGLGKSTHKPPIIEEDMQKLYQSNVFDINTPKGLQRKVFFEVMLYFCRRGQENLRELKKECFVIKKDRNGREYAEKILDELTKNRRESDEAQNGGIILATGKKNCPVKSLKLYLEKLNPKCDAFFQRPRKEPSSAGSWYDNQVVGKNSLKQMMKIISQEANLSIVYTNHSIRATSVRILDQAGLEACDIMIVTGHRSKKSIQHYSRAGFNKKRLMSDTITNYCSTEKRKCVRDENVNFDFGVEFDVPQQNVVIKHQVPQSSQTSDVEKFISNCNVYFKDCSFNFNK